MHLLPKTELLNEEIFDSLDDARRKLALWRYDYNAVMRGGFYDYFVQMLPFEIALGQATQMKADPPQLRITREPEGLVGRAQAVISGLVEDDKALKDLMIFHGEEKVFYQGGGDDIRALPFTVDLDLEEGENLVVIMARDQEGLTDIQSVNIFFDPEHEAASVE